MKPPSAGRRDLARRVGVLALTAAAALASAAHARPLNFDLQCDGESVRTEPTGARTTSTWSQTLHLDLESNLYCTGGCAEAMPLQKVTPTRIWLYKGQHDFAIINRQTGVYTEQRLVFPPPRPVTDDVEAHCAVRAASVAPKRMF